MADPSNTRQPPVIQQADPDLTLYVTRLSGTVEITQQAPGEEAHQKGLIDPNGNYYSEQHSPDSNGDGSVGRVVQSNLFETVGGGHTHSVVENVHEVVMGSKKESIGQGKFTDTTDHFHASDGDHITALSGSHKVLATDGKGIHAVQGDQSFITEQGRVDNYASDGYSITSDQDVTIAPQQDLACYVNGNEGHIINANMSFDVTGAGYINTQGTFTANSMAAMAFNTSATLLANSVGAMTLNSASTLSAN